MTDKQKVPSSKLTFAMMRALAEQAENEHIDDAQPVPVNAFDAATNAPNLRTGTPAPQPKPDQTITRPNKAALPGSEAANPHIKPTKATHPGHAKGEAQVRAPHALDAVTLLAGAGLNGVADTARLAIKLTGATLGAWEKARVASAISNATLTRSEFSGVLNANVTNVTDAIVSKRLTQHFERATDALEAAANNAIRIRNPETRNAMLRNINQEAAALIEAGSDAEAKLGKHNFDLSGLQERLLKIAAQIRDITERFMESVRSMGTGMRA